MIIKGLGTDLRTLQLYTLESRIAFAGWTEEHIKSYSGPTPQVSEWPAGRGPFLEAPMN
jgi:hypothetical protein